MHFLDMRTILAGQVTVSLACALTIFLLWRHNARRYSGLGFWAANYALQFASALLLLGRGTLPDLVSVVLANLLGMGGLVFLYSGLSVFGGGPALNRPNLALYGVFAVVQYYFGIAGPSLLVRTLNVNLFLCVLCFRCAWLIMRGFPQGLARLSRPAAYAFAGFGLVALLRIALYISGPQSPDFLAETGADPLLLLCYSGLIILVTLGLFLMVNRRLLADTTSDYNGRLEAEKALNASAGRLALALEAAGSGTWQWDIKRDVRHFDDRVCAMLGIAPRDFDGTVEAFFAAVHPDDREMLRAAMSETLETDAVYHPEYRVVWPDGSLHYLATRGRLSRDADGKPESLDGLLWDVTGVKTAEAGLKASEERFQKAFQSAPMLMSLSEIDTGRYIEVNDKFCEVSGYKREEVIGRTSVEIGWIGAEDRATLLRASKGKSLRIPEIELRAKDGRGVVCTYSCERLRMGEKDILLAIAEDVTAIKKAEAALQSAQKLESLGALAGGIAHDFNNLLTGITGNLSLIRRAASGGELPELVKEAEAACLTARSLARQLLTFASGGDPVKAPLDLAGLVAESVSFSLRGSAVKGEVEAAGGALPVMGDREQLFQALNNLVINAAQAMAGSGTVRVRASKVTLAEGQQPPLKAGDYALVEVADSGPGIPAEMLVRIFEPYFSTKGKGRGLGLAVSRSVISRHGGQIYASSAHGKGAVFSIYLPLTAAQLPERREEPAPAAHGGGRILVMEDDAIVSKALKRMLVSLGYHAEVVTNGELAVEAWRAAMGGERAFRAAIMDLTISGGMGGAEAVKVLRRSDPAAKVIVSSGYADDSVMSDCAAHGFDAALPKPYKVEELSRVLSELL